MSCFGGQKKGGRPGANAVIHILSSPPIYFLVTLGINPLRQSSHGTIVLHFNIFRLSLLTRAHPSLSGQVHPSRSNFTFNAWDPKRSNKWIECTYLPAAFDIRPQFWKMFPCTVVQPPQMCLLFSTEFFIFIFFPSSGFVITQSPTD